jgi:hypothetical protein
MTQHERRFPRIDYSQHAVLVKTIDTPAEIEELAETKSVGGGGCSFISAERLGDGTTVELMIAIEHEVVRARCRVVYETEMPDGRFETGVEFIDALSEEDERRIEELIAHGADRGGTAVR